MRDIQYIPVIIILILVAFTSRIPKFHFLWLKSLGGDPQEAKAGVLDGQSCAILKWIA